MRGQHEQETAKLNDQQRPRSQEGPQYHDWKHKDREPLRNDDDSEDPGTPTQRQDRLFAAWVRGHLDRAVSPFPEWLRNEGLPGKFLAHLSAASVGV